MKTFTATINHRIIADGHYCARHCPQLYDGWKSGNCNLFNASLATMQAGRTTVYHRCGVCFEYECKEDAATALIIKGITT